MTSSAPSAIGNISKLMMANLMEAWRDNRLRCASSRGVFKAPDARFLYNNALQITAADGSFVCSLSPSTVTLLVDGKPQFAAVNANSFGDNGVWIQVSCSCRNQQIFWLEIYVPNHLQPPKQQGSMLQRGSKA